MLGALLLTRLHFSGSAEFGHPRLQAVPSSVPALLTDAEVQWQAVAWLGYKLHPWYQDICRASSLSWFQL